MSVPTVPYASAADLPRQGQSGLGIASFVLAVPPLLAGIVMLLLLLWLDRNGGSAPPGYEAFGLLASVLFYGSTLLVPLVLASIALGVAGLAQRSRKRHVALCAVGLDALSVGIWAITFVLSST